MNKTPPSLLKKIIAVITALVLIATFVAALTNKAQWIAFWLVAASAFIIAKFVVPKLQ